MKRFSTGLLFLISAIHFLFEQNCSICAESLYAGSSDKNNTFSLFSSNASGRYFTVDSDDLIVLELIPAFGRLFASVGFYMNQESLYSYYAAEILPLCPAENGNCPYNHSLNSYDVYLRLFSNMSNAGNYWPGQTFQRLTLIPGGIMISDYAGGGYSLVSEKDIMMNRSDKAPSMFPYGPGSADNMNDTGNQMSVMKFFTGNWKSEWHAQEETTFVQFSLEADGTISMLRENNTGYPPLLLKGGFSISEAKDDSFELCYVMSSPSSGMMPYTGCVFLKPENNCLFIGQSADWEDELFLPYASENIIYVR